MTLYRKRPVVIDAVQFNGEWPPIRKWLVNTGWLPSVFEKPPITKIPNEDGLEIQTLEGIVRAEIGDWIIRGVENEFYICKPSIFEKTYSRLSSGPSE